MSRTPYSILFQLVPVSLLLIVAAVPATGQPAPTLLEGLAYDGEFFPGTSYDPAIPTPETLLGFRPGDRAALPSEIESCLEAWSDASPRARLFEYARSHEGRALYYMAVSSPANMTRLAEVKEGLAALADPRDLAAAEAERLVESSPAVAWIAYSIHGDETSGADASLAVLYHLIAGTSPDVTDVLDRVVVLIDPMENPDGRHRYLQQVAEHRAAAPNVDDQSLLHSGYWPWGRTNHYLFDLNRDWILGVNPESRGRIRAAGDWHPQLMVDGHEMGSQDTYLFSPARGPKNPHVPARLHGWAARFARDQSEAFDRWNWLYYNGEWNEGWYPGYTDAWSQFRGALGILYEQASFTEDGVRRPGGGIVTYREAVHHQAVSSIANLATLADNRAEILGDYLAERRVNVAADSPWADRVFALLPSANRSRLDALLDLLRLQGFELYITEAPTTVSGAVDQLGRDLGRPTLPAGTVLVPNRQPEARLVSTMLEFDGRLPTDYLERERGSILRNGRSTIYDVTAWNLTMLYGLEAWTLEGGLPAGAGRLELGGPDEPSAAVGADTAVGWIVDGADDLSVAFAARVVEQGVSVRVTDRDVALGDGEYDRGSVVVLPADNGGFDGDLPAVLSATATELGLRLDALTTGFGDGDLPDIGGGHFQLLEPPRIALLTRGGINFYDYGSIWHALDLDLGIRHSQLDETALNFVDLRRYNVVVVPNRFFGGLGEAEMEALQTWVEAGGTLIAIAGSAGEMAEEEVGISSVRKLDEVIGESESYQLAVLREEMARLKALPAADDVWSHVAAGGGSFPWDGLSELAGADQEEAERRDEWSRMFMPQGAFLAARTDPEHWLTFGVAAELPVLVNSGTVLMAKHPAEAPVRLGVLDPNEGAEARRVGWSVVPSGKELRLRMSGLLWPEAAARLANSAAVTRERKGNGQVILFANSPTFRASTRGTARLLMNAMIYGPGFGANAPIEP